MRTNTVTLALIVLLTLIAVSVRSCDVSADPPKAAEGQADASHESNEGQAFDILSLDGELPSPHDEQPEGEESVSEVPDDGAVVENTASEARVEQVVFLSAPWCVPCRPVHKALKHLDKLKPAWRIGPREDDHFRVLDIGRDTDAAAILERHGYPRIPAFVIRKSDGTETLQVGWTGGDPESDKAIDTLAAMFGITPESYRSDGQVDEPPVEAVGAVEGRRRRERLRDALDRHLQGDTVSGFYDTSFDVKDLIAKLMGGQSTVAINDGLSVSLAGTPKVELSSSGRTTRMTFTRNPVSVSYKKGWFKTSTTVPYVEFNRDMSKLTVGLKGLPDFPIYLEW